MKNDIVRKGNNEQSYKHKKFKQQRKAWFNCLKRIITCVYRRPQFVYLGEKPTKQSIIISNHEGKHAPLTLEMYADFPIRFWGTSEMNSGLKQLYRYQTKIYYHQKKHWNLQLAKIICLIVSPLTNLYYKGLNLISTYPDHRLRHTIKESLQVLKDGGNIVIFPEKSENGYFQELKGFYKGFLLLAEICKAKGIDVPIYVSYLKVKEKKYIFDAPIMYSELANKKLSRDEIVDSLLKRCNELGKIQFDN